MGLRFISDMLSKGNYPLLAALFEGGSMIKGVMEAAGINKMKM